MQRREFLKTAALAAAALPAYGQAINKLTDRLSVITGAGNNIVALASDAGSFLVDSGDAAHAQDVLRLAGRVSIVINTHWHPESTGGNDVLGRAGAKILAQLNTQLWMTQDIVHEWEKKTYPARAKEAWPTETFVTAGKASFAGEPIEWALMPNAHTDGDTYVHFTGANVLAVGDAVQPGRFPTLDWLSTGWIGGMQEAQRAILRRANDATRIVPAQGPVLTKAQVQASLDTLTKIREVLVGLMKQGKGAQDMIDAKAVAPFAGELAGNQDEFIFLAYRGLWAHARELGGIV